MKQGLCKGVVSFRVSVPSIDRSSSSSVYQVAALSPTRAGDINQQRRPPSSNGSQQQMQQCHMSADVGS